VGIGLNRILFNSNTMLTISKIKAQFFSILERAGFIDTISAQRPPPPLDPSHFVDGSFASRNSRNEELVKAVVCSGLYPNVCQHKEKRMFCTIVDTAAFLHPSSCLRNDRVFANPWFVYNEKVKSVKLYVRELSNIHPFALVLLTGGGLSYIRTLNLLLIDNWIALIMEPQDADTCYDLKQLIDLCVQKKVVSPSDTANNALIDECVRLVSDLFSVRFAPHHSKIPAVMKSMKGTKRLRPPNHSRNPAMGHFPSRNLPPSRDYRDSSRRDYPSSFPPIRGRR